jgi:hypothetical protein
VLGGLLALGVGGCASEGASPVPLDRATGAVLADAADRLAEALAGEEPCRALAEAEALRERADRALEVGDAPETVVVETHRVVDASTAALVCEPTALAEDAEDEEEAAAEEAPDEPVADAEPDPAPTTEPAPSSSGGSSGSDSSSSSDSSSDSSGGNRGGGNGGGNGGERGPDGEGPPGQSRDGGSPGRGGGRG